MDNFPKIYYFIFNFQIKPICVLFIIKTTRLGRMALHHWRPSFMQCSFVANEWVLVVGPLKLLSTELSSKLISYEYISVGWIIVGKYIWSEFYLKMKNKNNELLRKLLKWYH